MFMQNISIWMQNAFYFIIHFYVILIENIIHIVSCSLPSYGLVTAGCNRKATRDQTAPIVIFIEKEVLGGTALIIC